ncbi:Uncharacterised protein [uncultured archaeon]|nr:Uncharacterised protein [uncultured archaeon]
MEKKGETSSKIDKNSKKNFPPILKIFISLLIGFLPSFLYITFFIQYGSPLTNYIKFLSNLNSSWIAWVSAIVITIFIYFTWWAIKSRKNFKNTSKNRFILITIIVSLLIVFGLIAAQLSLYINFTVGNDILIKLSSDKENVFFTAGSSQNITFKMSVTMNPFCSAECNYEFFDEGSGRQIDTGSFNLTSISSKSESYGLQNNHLVEGSQDINRFEVRCKSKRTLLCYTSEDESSRSVLITLNYKLTEDEKQFKNESKDKIVSLEGTFYSILNELNSSMNNLNSINNSFSNKDLLFIYGQIYNSSLDLNYSISSMKTLWEKQDFALLKKQLPSVATQIQILENQSQQFNLDIFSNISFYNNLTTNLSSSEKNLEQISQTNLTVSLCTELNKVVFDFNLAILNFNNETTLLKKEIIVKNISGELSQLYQDSLASFGGPSCVLIGTLNSPNFVQIKTFNFEKVNYTSIIQEPVPICCFLGECGKCCDQTCSNENYPLLFLHGHPINKALPADYSLDDLSKIKQKLVYENYIDAGAMIISKTTEEPGLWGKINTSMMVTASYLFDTYRDSSGKEVTTISNTNSIDTYAIRLKSLVDLAKSRTGKEKVTIIAHSMGGLVARRYLQIFGGNDIDKLILVDVPNHGISGAIESYCGLFGQGLECSEMSQDSLFINNLNNNPTTNVPTYNIVGIGCSMNDETGDGIVTNSSQYLSYAKNYYIQGTCDELLLNFLHEYIVYPEYYAQTYAIIDEILKNSSLLK